MPSLAPIGPVPPLLLGFQLALTIMRQTGGLGISIAGGKGSTPYKGDDEVRVGGSLSGGGPGAAAGGRSQSPQTSPPPPPSPQGIFISRVSEEGPAAQAGVRVGDKLLEVGQGRAAAGGGHICCTSPGLRGPTPARCLGGVSCAGRLPPQLTGQRCLPWPKGFGAGGHPIPGGPAGSALWPSAVRPWPRCLQGLRFGGQRGPRVLVQ